LTVKRRGWRWPQHAGREQERIFESGLPIDALLGWLGGPFSRRGGELQALVSSVSYFQHQRQPTDAIHNPKKSTDDQQRYPARTPYPSEDRISIQNGEGAQNTDT